MKHRQGFAILIFSSIGFLMFLKFPKFDSPRVSTQKKTEILETTTPEVLKVGPIQNTTGKLTRVLPVSHVFLVSAYYYPTSKSMGANALTLNMLVDYNNKDLNNATYNVIGSNGTSEILTNPLHQNEGVLLCRYRPVIARTNTVANLMKVEMESDGTRVEIPFRMAKYKAPKPVIICISPQFVAEQWQTFLMHVHIAHRFGGHLHIYLISIIESYFDLMKEYERKGYVTLDFWLRVKFPKTETPYFEPNTDLEWRNQAGAASDCLLQYKEAAEFITFFDMDDILFMKDYSSYLDAFTAEWAVDPNVTSIIYDRKEHEFVKAETLAEFNFRGLLSSLRASKKMGTGKVVTKPDKHHSMWIHFSFNEDVKMRRFIKNTSMIHVQRPLQKSSDNNMTTLWKMEFDEPIEDYNEEDIKAIEESIKEFKAMHRIAALAPKLPSYDFYLPIVFKCYYDIFYGPWIAQSGLRECPNAENCEYPQREEYTCVHSDAEYYSGPHMEPFTFHFAKNPFWSKDIGCYT